MFCLAKAEVIFCENDAKVEALLHRGSEKLPEVRYIITMSDMTDDVKSKVEGQGWKAMSLSELEVFIYV